MPGPSRKGKFKDSRAKYDVDVNRMINEGMAGGDVNQTQNRIQIEQARKLPENDHDFPDTRPADNE
ncbi:hypothetical protein SAMN05421676_102268 [Salinibacillus kushneri]|uniref:Uncharacterized protein n=1 Tax=Salinibacillus kushneri TaxID=237682 RepID=A0A1I0AWA6_9BACI|nr:hypothetical protein [Salinibacillus kushneri]SES98268.1 hypothetical protein SAMN05421676_102268 [Salinibacillus kushneri]